MNKFYDLYMQDKVTIEDLDDFLEEWNRSSSSERISEYLGLSDEQYYKWCDDPNKLKNELDVIKTHQLATASVSKRKIAKEILKIAKEILEDK